MGTKGFTLGAALFFCCIAAGMPHVPQAAERTPFRTAPPAQTPSLQRGVFPAASQLTLMTPQAGVTIPLDGGGLYLQFTAKIAAAGKPLSFIPELVRNGVTLGPVFNTGFSFNPAKSQETVNVTRGHYISSGAGKVAGAGGGYQYKITVYEGTWGQGHKVIASGSSGVFTFGPAPVAAGAPQVTVANPKAGETIPMSGGVLVIQFSQKNMDPNKGLAYMPELVRNGVTLGPIFSMSFVLNKFKESDAVGVTPGHYISGYSGMLATAGGGYQYKITVFEGTYGQGHKVVASGLSGVFTLGPAPVLAGPPEVTVATPKTGETISKSSGVFVIQFSQKNMDPNKGLSYMPELVRNGVLLGPVSGMSFVLNKNKESDAVGVTPGQYLSGFSGQTAAAGGGYQYRITVFEGTYGQGHKAVATGLSGVFSLGP